MNDTPKLPALQSGGAIRAIIPENFDSAYRIANAVVVAGMAPKDLSTPERATIAILHGLEVGMPPMASLQSIAIINNRPCIWGDGALGLVQGSGKMETIKEWIEGEGDARVAYCRVIRRGDPEPKIGKFSVADAKKARLLGKAGPWQDYPERMLKMRARSWALRDAFADVLKGLAIVEEWKDIDHDPAEVQPTPPKPPKPPSLSQPITTSEPSQFAKNAKNGTPPVPPKPPVASSTPEPGSTRPVKGTNTPEEPEPMSPHQEADYEADELPLPGDMLSALDAELADAKDAETIEEIYDAHDIEAKLESIPQGEEFLGTAIGIKRKHLKRVKNG